MEAFNQSQGEIHVTFAKSPGGADNNSQLVNQTKAGNAPDVVSSGADSVALLATSGVLTDLSDVGGDQLLTDEFPKPMESVVSFGGSTWAIPYDASPLVLFYRADLFEQYGISVPATWDEYATAAEKVKAADPDSRIGFSIVGDPALYASLSWQNGAIWNSVGDEAWHINIDDAASREALQRQQDLLDADLAWNVAPEVQQKLQAEGKSLTILSGPWYGASLIKTFGDQSGDWRVAPAPSPTATPATGLYGGSGYGISSTSKHREEAMAFIKWMTTNPDAIRARLEAGLSSALPAASSAQSAARDAFDTTFFGGQDIFTVAVEAVDTVRPGWIWGPATSATITSLRDATAAVQNGTSTLPSVLKDAQTATVANLESRGIKVS